MATLGDFIRQTGVELCLQLYAGKYAQKFKDMSRENIVRIERAMDMRERIFVVIGNVDIHVVSLTGSNFPERLIHRMKCYAKSSTSVLYYGGWRDKEFEELNPSNMNDFFPVNPRHKSEEYPERIRVRKPRKSLYDEMIEDIQTKHKVKKGVGLAYEERMGMSVARF